MFEFPRIFSLKKPENLNQISIRMRFMAKILSFIFSIVVLLLGLRISLYYYLNQKLHLESSIIFEVKKGRGLNQLALDLSQKNIIHYPFLFGKIGQYYGYDSKIKYGEYGLSPDDSYRTLFKKIVSGDNYKYEVTFVEGNHQYKYAKQLEEKGLATIEEFLRLSKNRVFIRSLLPESHFGSNLTSLEGYLFPDTYFFSKNDGIEKILKTMIQRFLEKTENLNFNKTLLSHHQVVILASIIEKETGAGFERPLISSVFHNRLKKKMKLQTDPTIIYGILEKTGKEINNIRKKDILTPTSYNTYVIKGLPKGPISNPGMESIKAVLEPEETEYLYFVSKNNGTHVFSKTYREHLRAVERYQKSPRMGP